jgi:regulator of replication initiation timing
MAPMRIIPTVCFSMGVVWLLSGCGGNVQQLEQENAALRAQVEALRARASAAEEADAARQAELKKAQSEAQEIVRLRGEVTQLRTTARDIEKLRTENQQLRTDNQKLRGTAQASTPAPPTTPAANAFPRESWTFSGYTSPQAALVSAIWAMQQGNPKQYFESLTAEEQLRMSKAWEGKSREEIAAKHQSDVSRITGMRVVETQNVNADEVVMRVFIEGVNREERVSMRE